MMPIQFNLTTNNQQPTVISKIQVELLRPFLALCVCLEQWRALGSDVST